MAILDSRQPDLALPRQDHSRHAMPAWLEAAVFLVGLLVAAFAWAGIFAAIVAVGLWTGLFPELRWTRHTDPARDT